MNNMSLTPEPSISGRDAQQNTSGLGDYRVNPNSSYQSIMEQLTRQQYEDYLNRFQGTEDRLVDLSMSDELLNNQLERNQGIAEKNLNQAEQSAANAQAKFGLSDRRTMQQKRNLKMNNALSLATANNDTRSAVKDLQLGLMSGASNGRRDSINKIGGLQQ
ncbi:TPA: hypothetical protein P0E30_003775 [Vibrio harveyi]|nr:hypothetical protein [Vibrio harveyi]